MASRNQHHGHDDSALAWLSVAALAASMLVACEDSGSAAKPDGGKAEPKAQKAAADGAEKLKKRCEQLGQACGQKDKHKEQISKDCKQAAWQQTDKGCTAPTIAVYDCYEKEFCAKKERIWALDDFRVLTERHTKCVDERKAVQKCVAGSDEK